MICTKDKEVEEWSNQISIPIIMCGLEGVNLDVF
jgi:hypothetical protein